MPYASQYTNEDEFTNAYIKEQIEAGGRGATQNNQPGWHTPFEARWRDEAKAEYARRSREAAPIPATPTAPPPPTPAPTPPPAPAPQQARAVTSVARGSTDSLNASPGVTGSAWMGDAASGGRNRNSIAALKSRVY
jgi:hypothetical protein